MKCRQHLFIFLLSISGCRDSARSTETGQAANADRVASASPAGARNETAAASTANENAQSRKSVESSSARSLQQPDNRPASAHELKVPLIGYRWFTDDNSQTKIKADLKGGELTIVFASDRAQGFAGVYVDLAKPIAPGAYSALEYLSPPITSSLRIEVKLEGDDGQRQYFIYRRKPARDLPRSPDGGKVRLSLAEFKSAQPINRVTFSVTPSADNGEGWRATPQRLQFTISDVAFVP
jgi:hypothetical protein